MKSSGQHLLMLLLLFILPTSSSAGQQSLTDYINQYPEIDESALITCWMIAGSISEVETGNPVKGHICTGTMGVWTANENHALEYCMSRFPFHIHSANPQTGGQTICAFQINLVCDKAWTQIHNKCYRLKPSQYTFEEAKASCKANKPAPQWNAQVANYYSDSLGVAFSDMTMASVWVTVPDIREHFVNGDGEVAVYVQDAAYKYDTKPGTLILPEGGETHQALCEYTPPMTKAEMYYLAKKYSEIYPILITRTGASISSSSYVTVNSVKGHHKTFKVDDIKAKCASIGVIMNTNSYPLISISQEWKDAKDGLTNHRFYITAAFKNEGCSRMNYMDWDSNGRPVAVFSATPGQNTGYCDAHSFMFSKMTDHTGEGRYPTQAAFRAPVLCALHSYGFEYANCPDKWHGFKRASGATFCHFIENTKVVNASVAPKECEAMGAVLSGFDSEAEFTFIRQKLATTHRPSAVPDEGADTHFRLGATRPCKSNCFDGATGKEWRVGWNEGVSRDTKFLNTAKSNWQHVPYKEGGDYYQEGTHVSFRDDHNQFHLHHDHHYPIQYYICGKYAEMVAKKNSDWSVRQNGK